jgi:hypothetical protein
MVTVYVHVCVIGAGLIQRCVIIQRDEKGYGLTVSGDNPVYVQSVKKGRSAKTEHTYAEVLILILFNTKFFHVLNIFAKQPFKVLQLLNN